MHMLASTTGMHALIQTNGTIYALVSEGYMGTTHQHQRTRMRRQQRDLQAQRGGVSLLLDGSPVPAQRGEGSPTPGGTCTHATHKPPYMLYPPHRDSRIRLPDESIKLQALPSYIWTQLYSEARTVGVGTMASTYATMHMHDSLVVAIYVHTGSRATHEHAQTDQPYMCNMCTNAIASANTYNTHRRTARVIVTMPITYVTILSHGSLAVTTYMRTEMIYVPDRAEQLSMCGMRAGAMATMPTIYVTVRLHGSLAVTTYMRTVIIYVPGQAEQLSMCGMRAGAMAFASRTHCATAHTNRIIAQHSHGPQQHALQPAPHTRQQRRMHPQHVHHALLQVVSTGGDRGLTARQARAAAATCARSARLTASARKNLVATIIAFHLQVSAKTNPVAAIIAFHLRVLVPPARVQIKSLGTLTTGNCTCKGGKIFSIKSFTPPPPFGGEECVHPAPCPARMPALQISPMPLSPLVGVCDGEVYSKEGQCNFGSHTALSRVHAHPE